MLCRHCNAHVDACPHPRGCSFADYLNDPPGLGLPIRYPRLSTARSRARAKAEILGFDPFDT